MRKSFFWIVLLMSMLIITACNNETENTDNIEIIVPVETKAVEVGNLITEKKLYGRTAAAKQFPVIVQQPGELKTLKFENGETVKKDNIIATIKTAIGNQNIRAKQDGEIANLKLIEGSFVTTEEPLAMIIDTEEVKVTFSVTATTRKLFEKEDELTVEIEGKEYKAEILAMDTLPDNTGQFPIEAVINNEDEDILSGMTAKLILQEVIVKDTIIVPTEAIITEGDETFLYIVENDAAEKVAVKVKEIQSDETAIEANLKEGDSIIVNGHFTLSDGDKVEVVKAGNES